MQATQTMNRSYNHLLSAATSKRFLFLLAIAMLVIFKMSSAVAGGGGDEFDEVWDTIEDWTTGTLGKIIAGAFILVGVIGGVARQSLMAFAVGIAGAMGLNYAPEIVSSIMTASAEDVVIATKMVMGNGLQ